MNEYLLETMLIYSIINVSDLQGFCSIQSFKTSVFFLFSPSKLALLSQKYPKAPLSEMVKILEDIKGIYKECCEGDMVECMDDRVS